MNDEFDPRAAEYVLGLLDSGERAEFSREMADNPALRAAVALWETRLAPLAALTPAATPPAGLWSRMETLLDSRPPPQASGEILALRRAARLWRRAALFSGALAAALALFVVERDFLAPRQDGVYFAAVSREGGRPALIVRVDLASRTLAISPVSAETPEGKSLELWLIPAGETPRSLGVIAGADERRPAPQGVALEKASFAVTVEPPGGSPTGAPTGPVVYSGALVRG